MLEHQALMLTASLILIFGLFSKLAEKSPISAPMFFVSIGILASPLFLGVFELSLDAELTRLLAEITLIIILFTDASFITLQDLKNQLKGLPVRLLLIGLPLTMILGTITATWVFPHVDIWLLALLALILSPTDAALGQAVVNSKKVPLKVRESISVESGLNDGIALPPIFVCIAVIASGQGEMSDNGYWLKFMSLQLLLGPIIGALVGYVGGRLVDYAHKKDWMAVVFQRLASISIALLAYALAETIGGNGFIAAFFSGLFLGVKNIHVRARIQEFAETEGQMLTLFVFLLLGLIAVPIYAPFWDINALIYALLSLTVIRMLPVFICLIGSDLNNYSKFFIAWFGPRGIASILYLLIATNALGIEKYKEVLSVIVLTVLLSVFAHGITAVAMTKRFKNTGTNTK